MACNPLEPSTCVAELVTDSVGAMAKSFSDSANYAIKTCMEIWLKVPSPDVTGGNSPATWLSGRMDGFVLAAMFASILYGAFRMATSGTWDHLGDLGKSLAKLFIVSGAVGVATSIGLTVGDAVADWVLGGADARLSSFVTVGVSASPAMSIILSATVIVAQIVQVLLMLLKNAMVILLVGFLPLTSAATNTPIGQGAFLKALTWLAAFVCYKPIAAIIYAVAFKLSDSGQDVAAQISGLALMCLAIVALPALMKFLAPITAAAAGGSAGAISGAIVGGAVATGAVVGAGMISGGGGFAAAAPAMSAAPTGAQVGATPAVSGADTTSTDQEKAA